MVLTHAHIQIAGMAARAGGLAGAPWRAGGRRGRGRLRLLARLLVQGPGVAAAHGGRARRAPLVRRVAVLMRRLPRVATLLQRAGLWHCSVTCIVKHAPGSAACFFKPSAAFTDCQQ